MFEQHRRLPSICFAAVLTVALGFFAAGCDFDGEEPILLIEDNTLSPDAGSEDVEADEDAGQEDADVGPPALEPGEDGTPCESDAECDGGTCLKDDYWHGGHCTTAGCSSAADCAGPEGQYLCVDHPYEGAICVRSCDYGGSDDQCRQQYECRPHDSTSAWCGPEILGTPFAQRYDEDCVSTSGGQVSYEYDIGPDVDSYFVGIRTASNASITKERIVLPDEEEIDFRGENDFQAQEALNQAGLSAFIVPGETRFQDQLQSGTHRFEGTSSASSVCFYIIENFDPSQAIDLNVYLLGLEDKDLTFTTAKSHGGFQTVLNGTRDVFSQVGLTLGEIRYFELPQEMAEEYRVLHSEHDLYWLLNNTQMPGVGLDGALSINAFFLERFAVQALGLAAGAPGFAAQHGSWFSGLAVSSEYLGMSYHANILTGVILAHEMGHFLGLPHTSELDRETFDFIGDTPECEDMNYQQLSSCPDWGNLMFPNAHPDNRDLTPGQGFVMQSNPLSK